jgi:DNA polymerase-3 subunit alpha
MEGVVPEQFVHLHVHTEYSMLDGAARLGSLFAEVSRVGMPAVAMTDHGNMFGAYAFFQAARAAGVKPILGTEAYVAPESRFHKRPVAWGQPHQRGDDVSGAGAYTHITLLAGDAGGLRNLFRLSSLASLEGYYQRPRMDRELLAAHAGGVIATTGCPSGEVQTRLRLGQYGQAVRAAGELRDIFGPDNLFLELMDHGADIERRVRDDLLRLGKEVGLAPLVTNDSHYVVQEDAKAHEALLCVQTGKTLADPTRLAFDGDGYFIQPAQQMRALWDAQVPGACDNTLLVAERVGDYGEVFAARDLMPRFDVPEGESEASWLRREVQAGMGRRFPQGVPGSHQARVDYELGVIEQMGFPAYFLVVADLCRYARQEGIRVGPGRGSATGCMVAYALGITELDPIEHRLLFERFLNPERVQMPDIDLDFDERRRGDVIRYVTEKYGADRVAQIITFGTIKAKAALKDAARVQLGQPGFAIADRISKAMPPAVMGHDIPLQAIFDPQHPRNGEAAEVRGLIESDPTSKSIFDMALGLEGLIRQAGVHAAGVILSDQPLLEVLPIWRRDQDGAIITGWDFPTCEALGLLKMDFLGLRNLTVVEDALDNIEANEGNRIDLDRLPLADEATFQLLASGDTLGVFQLDGGPMRRLLRAMAPTSFEDIAAVLALYRPGPMAANAHVDYADRKNGRKPVTPIHPELAEPLADILDETYGLIVYQEQVMAIAQKVAGYSLGSADLLRRAMGKKKKEILDKEWVGFQAGMRGQGYSDDAIRTLWEILLPFAGYAFNKSHTAGYGIVSFWTAYLKANHPAAYMAALLTSVSDDKDKMAVYLGECRRMGVRVLPPDVNASVGRFSAVGADVRFGLAAVRNVGAGVVDSIVRARREQGEFTDFYDFLRKVDAVVCNKRTVESLIKAGAFDSLGHTRKGLLAVHADAIDSFMDTKRNEANGQFDLFGALEQPGAPVGTQPVPDGEWDRPDLLAFEREMLGLYVSDHPLRGVERLLAGHAEHSIPQIDDDELPDGTTVTLAGLLVGVQRRVTKQGRQWASANLEDLTGAVEVLFFPNTFEQFGQHLHDDQLVAVKGRVNRRDTGAVSVAVHDLAILDPGAQDANGGGRPLTISLRDTTITPENMEKIRDVLAAHRGSTEVRVRLQFASRRPAQLLRTSYQVDVSPALMADLKALIGAGAIT